MCEIFPEFTHFCLCINLRIGMLAIAVLGVVTGGAMLSVCEQVTHATYQELLNVTTIRDPNAVLSAAEPIIHSGLTVVSVLFMFTGMVLLFATLADAGGLVQCFVWLTFLNILLGYLLVIVITIECLFMDGCLLAAMDWLSAAASLLFFALYLSFWIYLISVANSYAIQS